MNTATQYFQYDGLNRLTRAYGSYGVLNYEYDAIGNMLRKGDMTFEHGEHFAGPHQVTSASNGKTFHYDDNGNMVKRGVDELSYDADNRLKEITVYKGKPGSLSYTLEPGWNAVTFPYLPEDESVTEVLDGLTLGVDYDQVSYYDPSAQEWKHFVNDGDFSDFTRFKYGIGYQIHVISQTNLTFTVSGRLPAVNILNELELGKNYIGAVDDTAQAVATFLEDVTYTGIKSYDTVNDTWVDYTGTTFELGQAYCVMVPEETNGSETLNLNAGWNTVRFSYMPENKTVTNVLSGMTFGVDYDQVSVYDEASQEWKHFVNDTEFNDFTELAFGTEYRIYVTNPNGVSVTVTGELYPGVIRQDMDNLVAGIVTSYTYGPDGERVQKQAPSLTTTYVGSGYEIRGTEGITSIFLGDFRIAEMRSSGAVYYLHTDHLNSTNVVTNSAGTQVQLYEYSPYGYTTVDEGDGTGETSYKFTGQEEDDDAALYYYHARYYDPELGRFIQADSIVQSPYDPQTLNRYAYCRNNPVKFVDPSGHGWIGSILAAVGAIIAIALAPFTAGMSLWACVGMGAMYGAVGGAIGGLIGGGIDAAIGGGSIVKGMLMGAATGAISGAISGAVAGAGQYLALAKAGETSVAVKTGTVTTEEAAKGSVSSAEVAGRSIGAAQKTTTIVDNSINGTLQTGVQEGVQAEITHSASAGFKLGDWVNIQGGVAAEGGVGGTSTFGSAMDFGKALAQGKGAGFFKADIKVFGKQLAKFSFKFGSDGTFSAGFSPTVELARVPNGLGEGILRGSGNFALTGRKAGATLAVRQEFTKRAFVQYQDTVSVKW